MNKSDRLLLKIRARYLCEYCQCPEYFNPDPFTGDHIIPESKGGIDDLINRALACWGTASNPILPKPLTLQRAKSRHSIIHGLTIGQSIFVGMNPLHYCSEFHQLAEQPF